MMPASIGADSRDCSRATGFIQHVHDGVMQGFVDGLQLGLHATYLAQDVYCQRLRENVGKWAVGKCGMRRVRMDVAGIEKSLPATPRGPRFNSRFGLSCESFCL